MPIVKLNYIKQEDKREIFLSFFQKNGKPMSLNEYVCKKHIKQLNKTYKTSFFHEKPDNNENQENNIFHEDPINSNSESIQNSNSESIQNSNSESIQNNNSESKYYKLNQSQM